MIEISPEVLVIVMMGSLLLLVMTGFPLGLVMGAIGLVTGYFVWGPQVADLLYMRGLSIITNYVLLAVPLFVFMGNILERSGITERMYDAFYLWLGGFRGGLAIATVLIGTIIAACVGIIAASITMLSLIAVPSMLRRGYDRGLATGATVAAGTLGILIPPSVMLVVYGPTAGLSVGKLFFGAFAPGLLLSMLYCFYIGVRCFLEPNIAPAVPAEQREASFVKKTTALVTSTVPTVILIMSVLGVIYLGIAPPTEAAGMGAFVAVLLALAYRKLTWKGLSTAGVETIKLCGLNFLIFTMSVAFTGVFLGGGGGGVVQDFLLNMPGGKWGAFFFIQVIVFVLGFFIDFIGIILITVPIITPILPVLGFDPVWFAIIICVNLQSSFMTPPFAPGIFVAYGTIPKEWKVSMAEIIRGLIPFIVIVFVALALCVAFPEIITWLPAKMIKSL